MTFNTVVIVALVVIASSASYTEAQVRYVDENGTAHWVASPEQVPERYRGALSTPRLPQINLGGGTTGSTNGCGGKTYAECISKQCRDEVDTADSFVKGEWQKYGRRVPMAKYLSRECFTEIRTRYPDNNLGSD